MYVVFLFLFEWWVLALLLDCLRGLRGILGFWVLLCCVDLFGLGLLFVVCVVIWYFVLVLLVAFTLFLGFMVVLV